MLNYTDLMETNLQNLRHSLTKLSLDEFVVRTLEGLMQVERKEYLRKAQDTNEKGNGHYSRAFKSLRRNAMTVSIPRTRYGGFSPLALELIKKNSEDVDDLCLALTRKGMTCRDIADVLETFEPHEQQVAPAPLFVHDNPKPSPDWGRTDCIKKEGYR